MAAKKGKKDKTIVTRGKRKKSIARATITEGKGIIRLNGVPINALSSTTVQQIITEPLEFIDASKYNIDVKVVGGGTMGQAQAARTAIARALVQATGNDAAKHEMMEYDRSFIVEDSRRVEPKKFKGPKARARFTKSYR